MYFGRSTPKQSGSFPASAFYSQQIALCDSLSVKGHKRPKFRFQQPNVKPYMPLADRRTLSLLDAFSNVLHTANGIGSAFLACTAALPPLKQQRFRLCGQSFEPAFSPFASLRRSQTVRITFRKKGKELKRTRLYWKMYPLLCPLSANLWAASQASARNSSGGENMDYPPRNTDSAKKYGLERENTDSGYSG